ncbi:hypothetical protein JXB31_01930 [Candidatus Woesearchaeota archaeon]|nr:hypothetical protein [Candidatus Woesearchaeota archaeon]
MTILSISKIKEADEALVGKRVVLLSNISRLSYVPHGFVITAEAYKRFISAGKLGSRIKEMVYEIDVDDNEQLQNIANEIQKLIIGTRLPDDIAEEIIDSYDSLGMSVNPGPDGKLSNPKEVPVFLNPSPLGDTSTGAHLSFPNILGKEKLIDAIITCFAANFTAKAIENRIRASEQDSGLAIVVQQMRYPALSGMVSLGFIDDDKHMIITASYGFMNDEILEMADEYVLDYKSLEIVKKNCNVQDIEFRKSLEEYVLEKSSITGERASRQKLPDEEICALARAAKKIFMDCGESIMVEYGIEKGKFFVFMADEMPRLEDDEASSSNIGDDENGLSAKGGYDVRSEEQERLDTDPDTADENEEDKIIIDINDEPDYDGESAESRQDIDAAEEKSPSLQSKKGSSRQPDLSQPNLSRHSISQAGMSEPSELPEPSEPSELPEPSEPSESPEPSGASRPSGASEPSKSNETSESSGSDRPSEASRLPEQGFQKKEIEPTDGTEEDKPDSKYSIFNLFKRKKPAAESEGSADSTKQLPRQRHDNYDVKPGQVEGQGVEPKARQGPVGQVAELVAGQGPGKVADSAVAGGMLKQGQVEPGKEAPAHAPEKKDLADNTVPKPVPKQADGVDSIEQNSVDKIEPDGVDSIEQNSVEKIEPKIDTKPAENIEPKPADLSRDVEPNLGSCVDSDAGSNISNGPVNNQVNNQVSSLGSDQDSNLSSDADDGCKGSVDISMGKADGGVSDPSFMSARHMLGQSVVSCDMAILNKVKDSYRRHFDSEHGLYLDEMIEELKQKTKIPYESELKKVRALRNRFIERGIIPTIDDVRVAIETTQKFLEEFKG